MVVLEKDQREALKPIRVWKGERRPFYYILDANCSVALAQGAKVRVLLEKVDLGDSEQLWSVVTPMIDRSGSSRLFDNAIDAHLGKTRPSNYQSGALPIPPPP